MLEIGSATGKALCSGISRRRAIEIGALSMVGLSLPNLLKSEARAADGSGNSVGHASKRSVILIWQHGGPSQLDTFDMKPDAPDGIRGPYKPIDTNVYGIQISEKLPLLARLAD